MNKDIIDMTDRERTRILNELNNETPGSAHYDDLVEELNKLSSINRDDTKAATAIGQEQQKIDNEKKRDKFLFIAKIASAVAALGTFLLMLKQEVTGSFRSKTMPFIRDFFRKSE
jgi:hypothetical protein